MVSTEKEEKVVSPPRKPVMTKILHSGAISGFLAKNENAMPIKNPPKRFAQRVPRWRFEKMGLSHFSKE